MSEALGFVCLLILFVIFWVGKPTLAEKITAIVDYHYEQVIQEKGKQHGNDKAKKGKAGSSGGRG